MAPKKKAGRRPKAAKRSKRTGNRKTTRRAARASATRKTARKRGGRKATGRATARKSNARKSTARKSTARKSTARKSTARKSTARKSNPKSTRAQTRKAATPKSTTRKSTGRKSLARRAAGGISTLRQSLVRSLPEEGVGTAVKEKARQGFELAREGLERLKDTTVGVTANVIENVKERIAGEDDRPSASERTAADAPEPTR